MRLPSALRTLGAAFACLCGAQAGSAADAPGSARDELRASAPPAPLTRIADIKMWPELAGESLPTSIEGVVIWRAKKGNFFVHDGELGIHVGESEDGKRFHPGDRVRVLGTTRRGSFAPSIEPTELVPLGAGVIPEPRRVPFSLIASGSLDGEWLEVEGVVCAVDLTGSSSSGPILSLSVEGRRLRVRVLVDESETIDPAQMVDALVRVRGVAGGKFNPGRQLVEPLLRLPDTSYVTIVQPPPPDPFALPLVPMDRLLVYSLEPPRPHRIRTRGVVTRQTADQVLFLREGNVGLRVELHGPAMFQSGDIVEAVGFPVMSEGFAVLQGAICRTVGTGGAVAPIRATLPELLDGMHSSNLVSVEGRLVDWAPEGPGVTFAFEAGNHVFKGMLERREALDRLLPPRNSVVQVTGICTISEFRDSWNFKPRSILLLLSSPADLQVLRPPSWWTAERLWGALIAVGAILLVAASWVWALRRQVGRKRAIIEQQARHAAVLEERSRIARELHDTLEQGLTGLSLQMKAMEAEFHDTEHPARSRLQFARQTLRQSRALARNAIRELRAEAIPPQIDSLADGLREVAESWNRSGALTVQVNVVGTQRPLPDPIEHHLLRIGTEAMINAVKHGRAPAIEVELDFSSSEVTLRVKDNGAGFDPAEQLEKASGCFGLIGMRERAREVGGKIHIQSRPGQGTQILVAAPIATACKAPAFQLTSS